MRVKFLSLCTLAAAIAFVGSTAWAQSSGSFNYSVGALGSSTTGCTVDSSSGGITGGVTCGPVNSSATCTGNSDCSAFGSSSTCTGQVQCTTNSECGTGGTCDTTGGADVCEGSGVCSGGVASKKCTGNMELAMKTSSGNGNVFDVRPSAVVALLTDVGVNSKQKNSSTGTVSSSAFGGVDFQVSLDSKLEPSGSTAAVNPDFPVTYDARFIQISTNLFEVLATQCASVSGGCFIDFNETTASAHSFDWIISPLTSGTYGVDVSWKSSLYDTGLAESETCVGPVNLTVTQDKIFQPSAKATTDLNF